MPALHLLRVRPAATLVAALALAGCASDSKPAIVTNPEGGVGNAGGDAGPRTYEPCTPDESAPVPANRCVSVDGGEGGVPGCGEWVKVELPGKVCGDGSQYKFFVNYSGKSNNLAISFEPGGACWDYESC